ncbi:hypothetical protein GCM10009836_10670 [Pseudonocardia ailaonensis]|uniref:ABM domain-containing protein n=1 Tax=Pseudonocardia ailaonensis TaxID=367279 RepID=A0ABN2MQX8_9PSEU
MILIVLKARIKPEKREDWLAGIKEYTDNVRSEPGNLSFDYYENSQDRDEFVIVETFVDGDAGAAHVAHQYVQDFFPWMGTVVSARPQISYHDLEGDAFNDMAEVTPQ